MWLLIVPRVVRIGVFYLSWAKVSRQVFKKWMILLSILWNVSEKVARLKRGTAQGKKSAQFSYFNKSSRLYRPKLSWLSSFLSSLHINGNPILPLSETIELFFCSFFSVHCSLLIQFTQHFPARLSKAPSLTKRKNRFCETFLYYSKQL